MVESSGPSAEGHRSLPARLLNRNIPGIPNATEPEASALSAFGGMRTLVLSDHAPTCETTTQ